MTPVLLEMERPGGSDPEAIAQVNGANPPVSETGWLYATPRTPAGRVVVVMTGVLVGVATKLAPPPAQLVMLARLPADTEMCPLTVLAPEPMVVSARASHTPVLLLALPKLVHPVGVVHVWLEMADEKTHAKLVTHMRLG